MKAETSKNCEIASEVHMSTYWDIPKVLLKSVAMRCRDFFDFTVCLSASYGT